MAGKSKFSEPEQQIIVALMEETDRGCVLAAHGHLDSQLEELLREFLRKSSKDAETEIKWLLSGGQLPPLRPFYTKTVTARVLGLLDDETFKALVGLNSLRNHFAHHPGKVSLTAERVDVILNSLNKNNVVLIRVIDAVVGVLKGMFPEKWKYNEVSKPRWDFTCVFMILSAVISAKINDVKGISTEAVWANLLAKMSVKPNSPESK